MKIKEYLKNNKNKALAYVLAFVLVVIAVVNLFVINSSALSDCDKYGHYFSNGQCTVCGYGCNHQARTWIIDAIPDTIMVDKHTVTEYCPECNTELSITYENCYFNGTSPNLTPECHGCLDPIISYSGEVETDSPSDICPHEFLNGICALCGEKCYHIYTGSSGGYCTICNYQCTHDCEIILTYTPVANADYTHVVRPKCTRCFQRVTTHPDNGAYMGCTFSGDTCTYCQRVCSHPQGFNSKGKCNICEYVCKHTAFVNGRCPICNIACEHSLAYRVVWRDNPETHLLETYCLNCKYVTKTAYKAHTYKDSRCSACWYVCKHTAFVDGDKESFCPHCDLSCKHLYSVGKCLRCGKICNHIFKPNSASCSICYYVADMPTENDDTLAFNLITSIYDAQATTFLSLLNYNIFGINLAMVVGALIVLSITFVIVSKKVK